MIKIGFTGTREGMTSGQLIEKETFLVLGFSSKVKMIIERRDH